MRTGIRFGLQVALVGVLAWGASPRGSWGAVNEYLANRKCVENTSGKSCDPCADSYSPSDVGLGCAWVKINAGALRPGSSVKSALFRMGENQLTESIYTPQTLNFVVGYAMTGISHERTRDGAPRQVTLVESAGIPFAVNFKDGESIGVPVFGDAWVMKLRLFMVDANGWATLANPAYYDLYTGDGDRYRFNAFKTSAQYMQLVSHRTVAGREETYEDMGVEVIRDASQILRQVLLPTRLADIVATNSTGYAIKFYTRAAMILAGGKDTNGCYRIDPNAAPFESWSFVNPEPGTLRKLRVTRLMGSRTTVYDFAYEADSENWVLQTGDGVTVLMQEEETTLWNDARSERATTSAIRGSDGAITSQSIETIKTFSWGDGVIRRITDPTGACLTNTYTYTSAGLTQSAVEPDGSWRYYRYDSAGRVTNELSGFKDSALTSVPQLARSIATSYAPVDPLDSPRLNDQSPRSITESILGTVVAKSYRAYRKTATGELQEIDETAVTPSAPYGAANSLRTVTTYYGTNAPNHQIGRLATVVHPDGRMDTYSYDTGTYQPAVGATPPSFEVNPAGDYWRESVVQGTTNHPQGLAGQTTMETTILDVMSQNVLSETWVSTGGGAFARVAWRSQAFDEWQHPILVKKSTGELTEASWGGNCCGKEWERDSTGRHTDYVYDALSRVQMIVRSGNPATGQPDLYTTNAYDTVGRQISQTTFADGLSQTTFSAYDTAGRLLTTTDPAGLVTTYAYPGQLTRVIISPGQLTNTIVSYPDGRAKCALQNGIIQSWNDYGVNPDGTQWSRTYTGPLGTNSPVWQKTTTDLLGRTLRTDRPGFSVSSVPFVATNSSFYNNCGQLIRTTSPGQADTLYIYDSLGAQTRSGLDLSGPDRVSESRSWYETDASNNYWQVSASILYPHDGSSAPVTNALQRTRLTGLGLNSEFGIQNSESISQDLLGNQTLQQTHIDRDTRTIVQVVTTPDSTNASTQVSINGLAQYSISKTGVLTTYTHDPLGRQIAAKVDAASPPRSVGSYTHYNSRGQVDWVADALSNRTTFAYCPTTGRRIATTDALTNTTHTAYDPEGRVIATWGATYPVAYEYDAFGRMTAMATTREPTNDFAALAAQLAAGASIMSIASTGSLDITQWLYDTATGLLTNKLYADNLGPSYTYTPDGKLATRTWARGVTTTYAYDPTSGAMTNILYTDGTPSVSFAFDRLGRQKVAQTFLSAHHFSYDPATLALTTETIITAGQTNILARSHDSLGRPSGLSLGTDYSVGYGYDSLGRFSHVSNFQFQVSYTYLPGSDLLSGWSNGVVTVVRSFEPNRDLLSQVLNMAGTNRVSQFDYNNDAMGRRTQRLDTLAGNLLPVTNDFAYNLRSELTDALMGTNTYGYAFDPIGNRERERVNANTNFYAANALNQYASVSNGVVWTPEYDLDGNILKLRDWYLQWDAENRLVSASNDTEVIRYQHDYMGRRILREVTGVTNRFDYDGWALIRERTYSQTHTLTNTYIWGLDLSGSLQGAGGIGGLLAILSSDSCLLTPVFDGNGNVSDLVDATGTIRGHYEYAPFGGLTAMTGDLAGSNPFRFSTKRQDEATDLLYYGYRDLDTVWGRWPSRDPIAEQGGANIYLFVWNNALNAYDLLGLAIHETSFEIDGNEITIKIDDGSDKKTCPSGMPTIVGVFVNPAGKIPSVEILSLTVNGTLNWSLKCDDILDWNGTIPINLKYTAPPGSDSIWIPNITKKFGPEKGSFEKSKDCLCVTCTLKADWDISGKAVTELGHP
jgi:RHS repeat-associated protein